MAEALAKGPPPKGNLAIPILLRGGLEAEIYTPAGGDRQRPHTRDEIYIVARGTAVFFNGPTSGPVEAGGFMFVPAGQAHHFENCSADFAVWVIFWGPEGGAAAAPG